MEIGPLHNSSRAVDESATTNSRPKDRTLEKPPARDDTVEIVSESRRRIAHLADSLRARYGITDAVGVRKEIDGEASSESSRIRMIQARVRSGYYDQADVLRIVADKMAEDFNS